MPKVKNDPLVERKYRKIVQRWYYWTEVKRIRFDDAFKKIEEEMFVREQTVMKVVRNNEDYLNELLEKRPGKKKLQLYELN